MPYSELYKGRYSHSECCYFITTVTLHRKSIFQELTAGRVVVEELMTLQLDNWASTLCYVVMPDHLHWLMHLHHDELGKVMQRIKGRTSKRLGGKLWQQRYYDHAVRTDEDIRKLARYIVANPLRKGLVDSIGDYPLWDAVWLQSGIDVGLKSDLPGDGFIL